MTSPGMAGAERGVEIAAERGGAGADAGVGDASVSASGIVRAALTPADGDGPLSIEGDDFRNALDVATIRMHDVDLKGELNDLLEEAITHYDSSRSAYVARLGDEADLSAALEGIKDVQDRVNEVLDNAGVDNDGLHGSMRNDIDQVFGQTFSRATELQYTLLKDMKGELFVQEKNFEASVEGLIFVPRREVLVGDVSIEKRTRVEGEAYIEAYAEIKETIESMASGGQPLEVEKVVQLDQAIRNLASNVNEAFDRGEVQRTGEPLANLGTRQSAAVEAVFALKQELTGVICDSSLERTEKALASSGGVDYSLEISEKGQILIAAERGSSRVSFALNDPIAEKRYLAEQEDKGQNLNEQRQYRRQAILKSLDPDKSLDSKIDKATDAIQTADADGRGAVMSAGGRLRTNGEGSLFGQLALAADLRVAEAINITVPKGAVIDRLNFRRADIYNLTIKSGASAEAIILDNARCNGLKTEKGCNIQNISATNLDIVRSGEVVDGRAPAQRTVIKGYKDGANFSATDFKDARLGSGGGTIKNMNGTYSDSMNRFMRRASEPFYKRFMPFSGRDENAGLGARVAGVTLGVLDVATFGSATFVATRGIRFFGLPVPPGTVQSQFRGAKVDLSAVSYNEPAAILAVPNLGVEPQVLNQKTVAETLRKLANNTDGVQILTGADKLTELAGKEIIIPSKSDPSQGVMVAFFGDRGVATKVIPVMIDDEFKKTWRTVAGSHLVQVNRKKLGFDGTTSNNEQAETLVTEFLRESGDVEIVNRKELEEKRRRARG